MPLNQKDFATASSKAVDNTLRADQWSIYRYEVKGVGDETYIQAPLRWVELPDDPKALERYRERERSLKKDDKRDPEIASWLAAEVLGFARPNEPKLYVPLDYPDLFLQFARLFEEGPVSLEVMLAWAEQYGVLGLRRTNVNWMGNPLGGPEESLTNFVGFAEEANMVLRLYEMISDPEGPDYEYVRKHPRLADILLRSPFLMKTKARYEQHAAGGEEEPTYPWMMISQSTKDMITQIQMERVDAMSPEQLKDLMLEYIDETIHTRVTGECHPRLYRQKDGSARRGWGFKSLLGAMWLQMMWLRSAQADEVNRCPWCRKTIAFEPQPYQPEIDPGLKKNARWKYKTRDDKTFCNPRCRAKWNYHYGEGKSSKHARKRKRERRKSGDN